MSEKFEEPLKPDDVNVEEQIKKEEFDLWKKRAIEDLGKAIYSVNSLSDLLTNISTELGSQVETISSSVDEKSTRKITNLLMVAPIEAISQDTRQQLADLLTALKIKVPPKNL